jgi:hypothetical protein
MSRSISMPRLGGFLPNHLAMKGGQYDPRGGPRDRARFVYRFEHETELTGSMTLALWVSTVASGAGSGGHADLQRTLAHSLVAHCS